MMNDLPVMVNTGHGRVPYGENPAFYLYFLDDNAWLPERGGIWVAGKARTEIVVRSSEALDTLRVTLEAPVLNRVTVSAGGPVRTVTIDRGEAVTVSLRPRGSYSEQSISYLLSVNTTQGVVPRLSTTGSGDGRFLGAFMTLSGITSTKQAGR